MGCRFCGFEFDRDRSRSGASSVGGDPCLEFARFRWDEREGALATGGATGDRCRCDISCLVVVGPDGRSLGLLAKHPIV